MAVAIPRARGHGLGSAERVFAIIRRYFYMYMAGCRYKDRYTYTCVSGVDSTNRLRRMQSPFVCVGSLEAIMTAFWVRPKNDLVE
jgi:hypothetical protein